MRRALSTAVAAALALPLVALAGLIGWQERAIADARILNVPMVGSDPRDLLRGHYLVGRLDWDWTAETAAPEPDSSDDGELCVLPGDAARPHVRFFAGAPAVHRSHEDCRLTIIGRRWMGAAEIPPRFAPQGLDTGEGRIRLFVPEARASDLEVLMREHPGTLTVDLAVRPDGIAYIRAIRIAGEPLGR